MSEIERRRLHMRVDWEDGSYFEADLAPIIAFGLALMWLASGFLLALVAL